ncbi:MAG: hypothetical protein KDE54_14415 [Caldilineaceae bacterium]|nr:hypothetical protein [Caldilineaceae bacterium]
MATTTTDANGHYSFTAYPGHYNIQVAAQPGYSFTPTGDSDVNASGWSGFHELTTNGTLTLDAGLGIPPAPVPPVTITKCYTFNGQPVAMRKVVDGQPDALYYLHADHLGSTVLVTDRSGNAFETQQYRAYGRPRGGGTLPTDHTFTGQKVDGTGLMYYRARYYDPVIGQFISPDTIVPDAGSVLDYNRFMYVRGRVLNANDPTGHNIALIDGGQCVPSICTPYRIPSTAGIREAEMPWGPSQSPNDNWIDLGFDWLLEHGPAERTFNEGTHMVDNLKSHPGVVAARQQYLEETPDVRNVSTYWYDFGLGGYLNAWYELDGTGHFLGSYRVDIVNNGDDTVTFMISNRSGRESFTNLRMGSGTYAEYYQKLLNGEVPDSLPRHLLGNLDREESWWGGNFDQIYTWQESTAGWLSNK